MSRPLRILLINAISPKVEVERRYPGLGLAYLASVALNHFGSKSIEFRIIDENPAGFIGSWRPDLAGISSVSQNFNIAMRYANLLSCAGIPVILGGVHISALPHTLPSSAVAGCMGEAEQSFIELVQAHLEGDFSPKRLAEIRGICFWDGDRIEITEYRPPLDNIDALPFPARDLLAIGSHTYMFTSRGCPYRCTFCSSSRFWDKLRFFSPEYVAEEIEHLARDYGVSFITFYDVLFAARRSGLETITRLLEKKKLLGKIRFTCSCRANTVTPEVARMLARMGIVSVGLGLESGDDEVLHYLKGKNISVEDNYAAINNLKNAGIFANASFIIGSPHETREQIIRTYTFIQKSRLDLMDIYLLTPFPGTPVWEYAKHRGLVSENMEDWSALDVNVYRSPGKIVILSEVLTRKELIALYKKFRWMRLRRNLLKIWNHPMRRDIPKVAGRKIAEMLDWKIGPQKKRSL